MDATRIFESLGYEQLRALHILSVTPDIEGTALCKAADCSWAESFALAEKGLIDIGENRLHPQQLHPTLTDLGREGAAFYDEHFGGGTSHAV
jgi:hypothetical protein